MSKKGKRLSPEIPRVGDALEVPNYVIPTTELKTAQNGERAGRCGSGAEDRRTEDSRA